MALSIRKASIVLKAFLAAAVLAALALPASAQSYTNGYTNSHGTYVEGYHHSAPNNTQYDNYSASGNVNPYTGEVGHHTPRY